MDTDTPYPYSITRLFVLMMLSAMQLFGQTMAIRNVTVIDPGEGLVKTRRTVVVEGRRIRQVTSLNGDLPKNARVIDGTGQFLIPGLWDAHVHLTKAGALSLPLFVANGVTSVRDMGSDFAEVARWRREIDAGTRIGPAIRTSGQILESRANVERMKREHTVEPVDRIRIGVANPEEGRQAVRRLAALGVDHIKMRTTPDLATFQAVADEAVLHHLPLAAHPVATPEQLIAAKLRSVEHLLAYPPLDGISSEKRQLLFEDVARSGMFLSATTVNLEGSVLLSYKEAKQRLNDTSGVIDRRRKYVCGYLAKDWSEQVEEKKDGEAEIDSFRRELPGIYRDMRGLREAGVPFLAGTDVAVVFMYPGFSLHDELANLVKQVGFSPMEVLHIATRNPHSFYRDKSERGEIEPGQTADLVLLTANPLTDIRNTTKIAGVITGGKWFDRAALDSLLADVERRATAGCK